MATMKDIAQRLGVSCTTVSNVLHGNTKRVSPETVNKINQLIQELGYVPNMSARSLVSNSSKVIAFVNHVVVDENTNFLEDPFSSTFFGILEKTLRENGYFLMVRTVSTSEDLISFLQNWNIDGLFFIGVFKDSFFEVVNNLNIPTVLIDSYVHDNHICNVGLEDYQGSYHATKYLLDRGHKKIAFASPAIKPGGVLQERFHGYQAALLDAKISVLDDLIFVQEMDYASCNKIAKNLKNRPEITAVVTTADIMAANINACLRNYGVRVPEDVSIIGFDDLPICRLTTPPLTTIHQDMNAKGKEAVKCMLSLLRGKPLDKTEITLSTTLIERESVIDIS